MVSAGKRKVVGVYLAAGSSRRMGTSKMSLELARGVPLGGVALQQALSSVLSSVVVVVREGDTLDWLPASALAQIPLGRCHIAVCPDATSGMAHSLRTGIQAAKELGAEGIMILLADQPFVDGAMLYKLTQAFNEHTGEDYIASGDQGQPKPPLIMGPSMWQAAASLKGDVGARSLFRSPMYRGRILEGTELLFMDIDTADRYEEAKKLFADYFMSI
ncbi:NTP transferase domain-containing protein [Paenibacillus sp. CGMCC 1.16610]|uniref:NTP transferase domain-containing protein n=1 Tax=Paenibacillus anseongense TaxID=2682845 RepID=A0ABW9U496_9BACL|nr:MULTISPECIES: nucleotidyltransferase family protein [Paenibacillus]MBA2943634.1 NTP transferase domain-containing protein [Paenibacillus sp. CGMCC 1.16610]MVQ33130.1 NTP transferase domain-containing protein [Paenibacillus anseongense]